MIEVFAAVVGLLVGPVLRLAVDRVPGRLPLFGTRPEAVGASVGRDLSPVVSWWSATTPGVIAPVGSPDDVADGEARATRVRRWRAPAIDLVTAVVFAALASRFGTTAALPAMLVFGAALVTVSVIDVDHYRIPDRVVFPALGLCTVLLAVASLVDDIDGAMVGAAVGAIAYFGFLFIFFLVSPSGMGFGDVKLALLLGLVLGWTGAVQEVDGVLVAGGLVDSFRLVLYGGLAGSVLGSLVGVVVISVRGRRAHFPFGPSLCLGALGVVLLSGPTLG